MKEKRGKNENFFIKVGGEYKSVLITGALCAQIIRGQPSSPRAGDNLLFFSTAGVCKPPLSTVSTRVTGLRLYS